MSIEKIDWPVRCTCCDKTVRRCVEVAVISTWQYESGTEHWESIYMCGDCLDEAAKKMEEMRRGEKTQVG